MAELTISIIALILSAISISYQIINNNKENKKEKREKYLERCVLYYRDPIKEILRDIKTTYKININEPINKLREKIDPLFEDLKYYIHEMKFFDKEYNTNIHESILDEILKCQTVIYTSIEEPDKYLNNIKEIIITAE